METESRDHVHMNHGHLNESLKWEYLKFALIILGIIIIAIVLTRYWYGWSGDALMQSFMGGFFLVFGLFKLLDLRGFVASYIGYDLIAQRSTIYAYLYPLIELGLGISYLFQVTYVNYIALPLMLIGAIGVGRQLVRGSHISCACLGTYVKLPLTTVSLIEDSIMGFMALYFIIR